MKKNINWSSIYLKLKVKHSGQIFIQEVCLSIMSVPFDFSLNVIRSSLKILKNMDINEILKSQSNQQQQQLKVSIFQFIYILYGSLFNITHLAEIFIKISKRSFSSTKTSRRT